MIKRMKIWGRDFDINVDFDNYGNEEASDEQVTRFNSFAEKSELLSDAGKISEYCLKNNKNEIGSSIDNIFKYIIPTAIFVSRSSKEKTIALLCDYKFDIEHGLAIVFKNNKFVNIVPQDEVL